MASHAAPSVPVRTYQEELKYIERLTDSSFRIKKGFVPNMQVSVSVDLIKMPLPVLELCFTGSTGTSVLLCHLSIVLFGHSLRYEH